MIDRHEIEARSLERVVFFVFQGLVTGLMTRSDDADEAELSPS